MLLLIDNFDSFTYNLVQSFQGLGLNVNVQRNLSITATQAQQLNPSYIVISPGPGTPEGAGISKELINTFAGKTPILGVCLGHQCIAEVFGGKVIKAKRPMHGKMSSIQHDASLLYANVSQGFSATRYHSLVVDPLSVPPSLTVTAKTSEGEIMGIAHKDYPIYGVQFHPESILTKEGMTLLKNFINL